MTKPDTLKKVFVKADDTATIHCPECQVTKTVAVGKFRSKRHTIKARCTCGHSFSVDLDFRGSYRKKTALPGKYVHELPEIHTRLWKKIHQTGTYTMRTPTADDILMLVTNISNCGLKFTTFGSLALKINQQIHVAFTLDDQKKTEINKHVLVQSITDNIIGCRFADNEPLEQGLRFYLFP
jgi:hypothetical protein